MKKEYRSEYFDVSKCLLYILLTLISSGLIIIYSNRYFRTPLIAVLEFILLCIVPFFFEKRIKQLFTGEVNLEFDENGFSVKFYKSASYKNMMIKWNEMKSYKFYFTPSKNTLLSIYLKNGKSKNWSFKDNKTVKEALNSESIFNIFYSYVNYYNLNKPEGEEISLRKGFYNTKIGSFVLYAQLILFIAAFTFHLVISPKSSILTLFVSLSIIIQQFIKKNQDNEIYKKIIELNN